MTTYVLVHGAWHSGQAWARIVPRLGSSGRRVLTPTLTGYGETRHLMGPEVGLTTHADDVSNLLVDEDLRDVVLVGHSYAGMVISAVANRVPERIARLVYLDAMVPVHGETAVDVMPMSKVLVDAAQASESGWRVPPLPEMPPPMGLFGVTEPADVAWVRTMLSDHSVRCLQEPVQFDDPEADRIPRTHIHCTVRPEGFEARSVPPVQPNGEPAHVLELPTTHDCMITMPDALADMLRDLG